MSRALHDPERIDLGRALIALGVATAATIGALAVLVGCLAWVLS